MFPSERTLEESGGGIYQYIVAGGKDGRAICDTERERKEVCALLMSAAECSRTSDNFGFRVHAYCVDNFWLQAVIEAVNPSTLAESLRQIVRQRPMRSDESPGGGALGSVFEVYDAVRLYLASEVLAATRHCHVAPVDAGLISNATMWSSSSHRAYLSLEKVSGLTRGTVASFLSDGPGGWPLGYGHLMGKPEEGRQSVSLWRMDIPILPTSANDGDLACLALLRAQHVERDWNSAFEQSIDDVCDTTECGAADFRANPSDPRFKLQRALIVEHLTQNKFMTVKDVARRLGCDRSWSYQTRKECRARYPELFKKP